MSEIVTGAGQAPAEGAAPAESAPPVTPAPKAPEPQPAIADLLAQHRRARQEAQKTSREAEGIRAELAQVKAELEKYRGARKDIIADPVGFLRAHGVTDQELPLVGEAAFYERMPDKAPADLRARMLEAKLERERRQRETEAAERATAEQVREAQARIENYRATLEAASASAEGFPLSAAWFGADGRAEYVESLIHTARNLAHAAEESGEVADLSPANVRKVLEDWLAERAGRLPGRAAPVQPKREEPRFLGEAPRGVSAQGAASSGGASRPPADTDSERVRRAIAAMDAFDAQPGS